MMHYGAMSCAYWLSPRPVGRLAGNAASISTLLGPRRMRNVVAGRLPGAKLEPSFLGKAWFRRRQDYKLDTKAYSAESCGCAAEEHALFVLQTSRAVLECWRVSLRSSSGHGYSF